MVSAVKRELADFESRAPGLAGGAIAASALAMAGLIDSDRNSATSKSMCHRALMEALDRLRALAPPERQKDGLDELADRRSDRRRRAAAADL